MIDIIKSDIKKYPTILFPFGRIGAAELKKELNNYNFKFPSELVDIWSEFGGGDFFQTETILYPYQNEHIDNIVDVNNFLIKEGMPVKYFAFHIGRGEVTAFLKEDNNRIVNLKRDSWQETYHYSSFKDWFADLRMELISMRYSEL